MTLAQILSPPPPHWRDASLFLDFDGTLVELAETPDAVIVDRALIALLTQVAARLPGRVAIVSGRSIAQLDDFFGDALSSLAVSGSHGAERRVPGVTASAAVAPGGLDAASDALAGYARANGIVFERKTLGAGLHYRAAPAAQDAARAFAQGLAAEHDLVVQHGKMMVELRAPGDKGQAVAALMETPAMRGTRPLVFGDDVTDEDGFAAAVKLGGAGVLVGEPRETAAAYALADVAALREWLAGVTT
ncbi:trehalose-phosphatase [Sphingomonas sp.]|jgi:trehalose 6-phosphate phosphatase|uniref:trehalose-phosphatase n=1 Tax=Sphingomonas sp. TaxID=28214 RepID=UPI002EDB17D7